MGQPNLPTRADYLTNLGLGLLVAGGPSSRPVGLGQAVGQAGLGANQMQQQGRTSAYQNQLYGLHGQQIQNQLDQMKAWQDMWAPQPAQAQVPSAAPAISPTQPPPVQQIMSQPGQRPGPTPQAAAQMAPAPAAIAPTGGPVPVPQAVAPQPTQTGYGNADVPQALLPALRVMGPQAGANFLAQMAAKNMERGQYVPETRVVEGKTIEGQRDRLSGKWTPLDPTMTKLSVNPSMSLPPQETAFQQTVGKAYGETFAGLQNSALTAGSKLGKLDRLDNLLSKTYTGMGGEATQAATKTMKAAADALGIPSDTITERVGAGEAATALAGEMALMLRNPSGGAGMPGAMSDKDREFLQSMIPGIATTQEGRKLILETQRRLIKRETEVAKLARDYKKSNGDRFDDGFFAVLQKWSDEHPLFKDMSIDTKMLGGASAPIPPATPAAPTGKVLKYNPATGQIE